MCTVCCVTKAHDTRLSYFTFVMLTCRPPGPDKAKAMTWVTLGGHLFNTSLGEKGAGKINHTVHAVTDITVRVTSRPGAPLFPRGMELRLALGGKLPLCI